MTWGGVGGKANVQKRPNGRRLPLYTAKKFSRTTSQLCSSIKLCGMPVAKMSMDHTGTSHKPGKLHTPVWHGPTSFSQFCPAPLSKVYGQILLPGASEMRERQSALMPYSRMLESYNMPMSVMACM
mgnify:CR=1 FL=1